MKKPRFKRALLPDGRRVFCLHSGEVRGVHEQAQAYAKHGIEIRPGDTVFDVGANIGLFALEAAQKGAQVQAFEPMPVTFAALVANADALGEGKITVHNLALGARSEKATFTYFPYVSVLSTRFPDSARKDGPVAIERIFDDPKLTPRCGWFRRAPQFLRKGIVKAISGLLFTSRRIECRVETLSQQIEAVKTSRVDLLKIDVEGAEMAVLEGISATDWPKISQIVAEVHDENGRLETMRKLLEENGFQHIFIEEEPEAGEFGIYLLWARRN